MVTFSLRLTAFVLAFESIMELVYAWGELGHAIPGVSLVLLAGDPPVLVACILIALGAPDRFLRRASLVALVVFGAGFVLVAGDILASRFGALSALRPFFDQAWLAHAENLCEVVGCAALVLAGRNVFLRAERPRPASLLAAAASTLSRAVAGLAAGVWPRPAALALVAVTGAATFATIAWLLFEAARLVPPRILASTPRRLD